MEKKRKIALILFLIIFAVDIILTGVLGLRANMYYSGGTTIRFQLSNTTIDIKDIKSIANEVFGKNCMVKKVEFFNDNALIKVKEANDDQLNDLCTKINDKYSSSITTDDLKVEYQANVKIRSVVEPYIIPVGISVILILVYYAIRFKGSKEMAGYIKAILGVGIIYYGLFAICRVRFSELTMPIAMSLYALTTLIYTTKAEINAK